MNKISTIFLASSTAILVSACGGDGSSDNGDTTPPPTEPVVSLVIPIDGNTVRNYTFLDENVLFTRGCVTANLYDSSNSALDRDSKSELGVASQGVYKYVASPYSNYGNTVYAVVYATSMSTVPQTLISGTTYALPAGGKDIKKLVINETETLVASASSSAHVKVYDSNLDFVSDLYVTDKPISIGAGTYYLLLKNGSCTSSTKITVNIL